MNSWYSLSVIALLLLGTQRFLYKVAAEKQYSSGLVTAVFMGTVTLLSAVFFFSSGKPVQNLPLLFLLSLLNSSSFAATTIANIEALRHLPAGIIFPLTRMSLVLVILVSLFYFGEELSAWQWLGIFLGFAVVVILTAEAKGPNLVAGSLKTGLFFVGLCIFCGALASISSKLAADSVNKAAFMTLSYLFATGFSLLIEKRWGKGFGADRGKGAIGLGLAMGALNFFGFYAFLAALSQGPLSTIAVITGMHFVVAILLSILLYHEKITSRRCLAIGLMLLAVILLKQ